MAKKCLCKLCGKRINAKDASVIITTAGGIEYICQEHKYYPEIEDALRGGSGPFPPED